MSKQTSGDNSDDALDKTYGRIIRRDASELRRADPERLARLRERDPADIDTSDMPEVKVGSHPVEYDESGRIIHVPYEQKGPICRAILDELGRREMNRRELWERARDYNPSIPESDVYEYLRGRRSLPSDYLDAMLAALGLSIVSKSA